MPHGHPIAPAGFFWDYLESSTTKAKPQQHPLFWIPISVLVSMMFRWWSSCCNAPARREADHHDEWRQLVSRNVSVEAGNNRGPNGHTDRHWYPVGLQRADA